MNDTWIPPFTFKLINNFLDEKYYTFLYNIIQNKQFSEATQGINGKNIVQKQHKIRLDYTLTNTECAIIDKPLITKADCKCNLRERWRLLYYKGEDKSFRDRHTDWTTHSCHRRMSIVIGLSDIHDYEGGELVFNDLNVKLKIPKGSAIIFDAKLMHEVLPIISGNRYVLQAFMFDDSGYALKTVKNDINSFKLRGADIDDKTVCSPNQNIINSKYQIIENKNAHYNKIKDVTHNYIGTFNYLKDIETYIENNNIFCFTWHKPNHLKSKWAGRAYKWTMDEVKKNNRYSISSWPSENNVISGILNSDNISNELYNTEKTLTVLSTNGGPGNQIIGLKK